MSGEELKPKSTTEEPVLVEHKEVVERLRSLSEVQVQPSVFMKSRVLANVKASQKEPWWAKWLWPAVTFGLVAILVLGWFNQPNLEKQEPFTSTYALDQPYLIRFDIRALKDQPVAYAEVSLEDSKVQFISKKFVDIQRSKNLVVHWENLLGKQYLPVVIKGVEQGVSNVKVRFYNKDGEIIKHQNMVFHFNERGV